MELVVKGRRTEVRERFRQHVSQKLAKLSKLDGKVISVDVEVSRERNPRLADRAERVEITVRTRGPVIRAEACAADAYAALDAAYAKLESRLRRAADRRRVHYGRRTPVSLAAATAVGAAVPETAAPGASAPAPPEAVVPADAAEETAAEQGNEDESDVVHLAVQGEGPLVVREKLHEALPMTLDHALYEMELVGHDFYLFVDADSGRPSVVYRRRGYDYGVIRLAEEEAQQRLATAGR